MIDFTRINNDTNGNPRYVCHFLEFKPYQDPKEPYKRFEYSEALNVARTLGGKKFHNKQYGGGIVFQSYNIESLIQSIREATGNAIEYNREPTAYEIKQGYGARHYKSFERSEVTKKDGELKKRHKCKIDGLIYTRY